MKNLIKAQLYQLKRNKFILITLAVVMFMQIVQIIGEVFADKSSFCAFWTVNSTFMLSIAAASAVISAVLCVGGDFHDKTSNYEILNGYTRFEIYASKNICGLAVGTIVYLIDIVLMCSAGVLILGFGTELSVTEVVLRLFLSVFVTIRLICVFILFTFVVKIFWLSMAVASLYLLMAAEMVEMFDTKSYLLGVTVFARLSEFISWTTYTIGDKIEYILVYGRTIQAGESAAIILSSLGIGALALIIGFFFFKTEDID